MRLNLISGPASRLVIEGAKTLGDIREDGLFVLFQPDAPSAQDALQEPAPRVDFNLVRGRPRDGARAKFFGGVQMEIPINDDTAEPVYELGVYAVHSEVPHGYGPFLYDLAAEYATMHGYGIMSAVGSGERLQAASKDAAEYRRAASSAEAGALWRGYDRRRDVRRTYGGPGYDERRGHMTSPLRKAPNLLLKLQELGMVVDRSGRVVDFRSGV